MAFLARAPATAAAPGDQHPGRPGLPLARLRARGELVEVRAADLRFTRDEAAAYLNDVDGLRLTADDIAALEARTEGGSRPCSSPRCRCRAATTPPASSPASPATTGSSSTTSSRRCSTGSPSRTPVPAADLRPGPAQRRAVRRGDRRARRQGDARSGSSGRTCSSSRWTTSGAGTATTTSSPTSCAPGCSTSARRRRGAAPPRQRLVRRRPASRARRSGTRWPPATSTGRPTWSSWPSRTLRRHRQEATLRGWLDELPDELVARRPVLAMGFIGALMASGEFDGVERRLRDVERLLAADGGRDRRSARSWIDRPSRPAAGRASRCTGPALALIGGDPAGTIAHARRALDRAPERRRPDAGRRPRPLAGLASWTRGDLEAAHRSYTDAADGLRRRGLHLRRAGLLDHAGRHRDHPGPARRRHSAPTSTRWSSPASDPASCAARADMYVGLSQVASSATTSPPPPAPRARDELGEQAGLPQNPYRWRVAMALLREAEGDLDAALELLDEAERVYNGDFSPNVDRSRRCARGCCRARRTGRGAAAGPPSSGLTVRRRAVLPARVRARHPGPGPARPARATLAAAARRRRAAGTAAAAAEDGGRTGSVIEILVLLALAQQARRRRRRRAPRWSARWPWPSPRATCGSSPTKGAPMAALLDAASTRHGSAVRYARPLLAAPPRPRTAPPADRRPGRPAERARARRAAAARQRPRRPGHRPASSSVSLNTVRTHTKNIYAKLGVNNRRAAVRRATSSSCCRTARDPLTPRDHHHSHMM